MDKKTDKGEFIKYFVKNNSCEDYPYTHREMCIMCHNLRGSVYKGLCFNDIERAYYRTREKLLKGILKDILENISDEELVEYLL